MQGPYLRTKKVLIGLTYICLALIGLDGCRGCHRERISPNPSEESSRLGGIPNLGNSCYMNSVLQIIAKLYPNIFEGKDSDFNRAGQVIVNKVKSDQDYVTVGEAWVVYTALLDVAKGKFKKGRQESSDECMDTIWQHLGLPNVDNTLGTPYITLALQSSDKNETVPMSHLIANYTSGEDIDPANFLNNIVPIKLARNDNAQKVETAVIKTLQLTITNKHIPSLLQEMFCRLVGFIVHNGDSAHAGHYTACIQQAGQWKLYNDEKVTYIIQEEAERYARQGYLYFYRRTSS